MPRQILSGIVAFLPFLALVSCNGTGTAGPETPVPKFESNVILKPNFSTVVTKESKIFLRYTDMEDVPELRRLGLQISEQLAAQGLKVTPDPAEADYNCEVCLRYFNVNAEADKGASVIKEAVGFGGGQKGWIVPGSDIMEGPRPWTPIDPKVEGGPSFSFAGKEWCLLMDVTVGEKSGGETICRNGRLMFHIQNSKVGRDEALFIFKYDMWPAVTIEEKNEEGKVVGSHFSHSITHDSPPTRLLDSLMPLLLPIPVGGVGQE